MTQPETPRLIPGDLAVDERGQVAFVNDFGFPGVKRFYVVGGHAAHTVRAWQAHRREAKYVFAVQGAALVGAVRIDDWSSPSPAAEVHRFVLSAHRPAVLFIPPGWANGNMVLTADTRLLFFSTSTLDESKADDVRFPARHWDIWRGEGTRA